MVVKDISNNPQQRSIDSHDAIENKLEQAMSFHQMGQLQRAEEIYQQILTHHSQNAEALHLLGVIAYQVGKYRRATCLITQAIEIDSSRSSFFNNLGLVLLERKKYEEAIQAFQRALEIQPDYAEAYNNLGVTFKKNRDFEEAVRAFRQALKIRPSYANNLGNVKQGQGELEEALQAYQQVFKIQPNHAEAYYNLGNLLQEQGKLEEAIEAYQRVLEIQPNHGEAYNNLGVVFNIQECFDKAVQAYHKAMQIKPNSAEIYCNLGNTLHEKRELEQAIQAYDKAIKIQPDYAKAHSNLGITLLLKGDSQLGWQEYEWRLKCRDPQAEKRRFFQPFWDGSSLNGKTILLYAEQGFGDTIQFIRYVNMLLVYDGSIIVECQPELLKLFENIDGITELIVAKETPPDFNVHASLVSLPSIFGTTLESIPSEVPYLFPKSNSVISWSPTSELKIGIVWAGSPKHPSNGNRSIVLRLFSVLFEIADCQFYSLQVGPDRDDIARYNYSGIVVDLGANFTLFSDTAAAILELDLIISVDTVVAHLAGALGKEIWTLLLYMPDWRWLLDRENTPWYPTMRLFRQNKIGDWAEVFERVRSTLEQYVVVAEIEENDKSLY